MPFSMAERKNERDRTAARPRSGRAVRRPRGLSGLRCAEQDARILLNEQRFSAMLDRETRDGRADDDDQAHRPTESVNGTDRQ
jgi:hypothetical protein